MDLAGYMVAKNLDDAAVGALISKSRSRVSRYRRGLEEIPGPVVKQLVEMSAEEPVAKMTADELLRIQQPQAVE